MRNIRLIILAAITALVALVTLRIPVAGAAEFMPPSVSAGSWHVSTLARSASETRIESFKHDGDLVAWTEVHDRLGLRTLYAFDGAQVRTLAVMPKSVWDVLSDALFVDPVSGAYDVADGVVVWTMHDGADREIFKLADGRVLRVSDNSFDDRHPVTSGGRVAWTGAPNASSYDLMVSDAKGLRRLDTFHVLNYAFSGDTLYWMNRRSGEAVFRIYRENGKTVENSGQGDDRVIRDYFVADGRGGAAWEYSTKRTENDLRLMYSWKRDSAQATTVALRVAPRHTLRIEDADGATVMFSDTDVQAAAVQRVSLVIADGAIERTPLRADSRSKARFIDGGFVRQAPGAATSALILNLSGTERQLFTDLVLADRFDADGNIVAGAKPSNGVVAYDGGSVTVMTTVNEADDIRVAGGSIAWTEGNAVSPTSLVVARPGILTRTANGIRTVSGYLVKSPTHPAVYLAATDGRRYVFPNATQFLTWYKDFSSVTVVSDQALAGMPLGGNVLFKPGSRLIKTAFSPRIYAVGKGASLNWVTNADILAAVYGPQWERLVVTVDDALLADYPLGAPVTDAFAFFQAFHVAR